MRIGVVGAGITGLALGRELERRGLDPLVLEATGDVGGVMRSIRVESRVLERGPQRVRLTPPVARLVRELRLDGELVTAPRRLPLYVYHAGRPRLAPLSLGQAIRTDLISWRGKARLLREPLADGPRHHETVATFLTRSFGREAYERLLGPLYGGLYGSDPADMLARLTVAPALETLGVRGSALAAFVRRSLRRGGIPPACSFRDGLQTLPRALARTLGDRVRLRFPVRSIRRAASSFQLVLDDGPETVDRVVLTTPARETAELLRDLAPDAAERIGRLRYNPLAVVHLLAPGCALEGLGCQVSFAENTATRGVTWNASLFNDAGRDGVYTSFLGGTKRSDVAEWSDERIAETAVSEFRRMTRCDARVLRIARVAMPAWDRTWTALDGLELPPGVFACANWESRAGIAGRLAAAERLATTLSPSST